MKTNRVMKISFFGHILAAVMFATAGSAQALSLSLIGGTSGNLNGDFSLATETGLGTGDVVTLFDSTTLGTEGLSLDMNGILVFEYLGSEASFTNTFTFDGVSFTNNPATPLNTTDSASAFVGLIPFIFATDGGGTASSATNGGTIDLGLSIAFAVDPNNSGSFIALLGDGSGDSDFDDLAVRISTAAPVPLPAAVWLFMSAIVGLVSIPRTRRGATSHVK